MSDESRPISEKVIAEIADRKKVKSTELRPPLYETIDLEALDALFSPGHDGGVRDCDGHVEFTYDSYRVRVESDGSVVVSSGEA
ncbi:HalOD1 output domain-containing protein [Halorussus salinisoli]|uniref:HalOD1 output domain-containing protein n=1 Tax=Halorussus salinisoli TaxID=2558242 RepID=UPI002A91B381|nr:HalOD1 output domain-containing protein [Halorussus salinisoli]